MAPLGSILYTALWIGWFAAGTILYFPDGSHYMEQLPMRMIFLGVIGVSALGVANELNKRRDKLVQQNRQTIGMLAKLVEGRDTDAGMHLQSIQHYSRALALHLGLSRREADEIAYASMVHDVGKANVPDAVLKKDGPLDRDEWAIMQAHTRWGEELLIENSDFEMAREVARWHHERWDGSGYPDGLSGEDIPFVARIVAVADVYDALISKRPYKEAWPPEKAIAELRRLSGSHLDPEIVAAFCHLWERGDIKRISDELGRTTEEEALMLNSAA
jgi:putative two-component system response regulator